MTMLLNGQQLALYVLKELMERGMQDVFSCPGTRNASFTFALEAEERLNCYTHFEERSAAFFALGRAKKTKRATAIIVTSGTAAGELYPAVMDAYYAKAPLVLITADRPRRYRGTGAPQTAEQKGMFGPYALAFDIEEESGLDLSCWDGKSPLHINVSLEDPNAKNSPLFEEEKREDFESFLARSVFPIALVGPLEKEEKEAAIQFLLRLNCPIILESLSLIREEPRLQHLHIRGTLHLLKWAEEADYKIDAVIRIGGVPILRFWRDLEGLPIKVCSISHLPFTGSPKGFLLQEDLSTVQFKKRTDFFEKAKNWFKKDQEYQNKLIAFMQEEPHSSPAMLHKLSKILPKDSLLYMSVSLTIRDWDLAACLEDKGIEVYASSSLNGIDGQLSTFFGLCNKGSHNFALLGDLTTLYDMAAPWVLPQMPDTSVTIFVINNGGGKIFSRLFKPVVFQNNHALNFKPFAEFWGLEYELFETIPTELKETNRNRLIEIRPCNAARDRLIDKLL